MQHFTISSTRKPERLHCVIWTPKESPKGLIQIIHGMSQNIEQYKEFAHFFVSQGYVVFGHDHLGHGKTKKSSSEYGFFAPKNGHNIVIKDIHRVYQVVRKKYPTLPCFALGHSMGSYFLRKYITIYGKDINGAILSGTGNQSFIASIVGYWIAQLFVLWKGDHYRSELIYNIVFDSYARSVKNRETDFDWLSRDKENVRRANENALNGVNFTVSGNRDFMKILWELSEKRRFSYIPKELPIFLISEEEDPVGDKGKGIQAVCQSFKKLGITDVTMKLYEEDRHEILNEVDRYVVFQDVLEWIQKKERCFMIV